MAKSTANKKAASKSTKTSKSAAGKSAAPASKHARSKTAKPKVPGRDKPIKYEDKSAGQPELVPIFEQLRKLISTYEKGSLVARGNQPGGYSLWSDKTIEVDGRQRDDVYFAGILVQKGYVGFYFMPIYNEPSLKSEIHPQLLKCLKGKSCFHIKKNDPEIMQQVKDALKTGYDYFKQKGWV